MSGNKEEDLQKEIVIPSIKYSATKRETATSIHFMINLIDLFLIIKIYTLLLYYEFLRERKTANGVLSNMRRSKSKDQFSI